MSPREETVLLPVQSGPVPTEHAVPGSDGLLLVVMVRTASAGELTECWRGSA